jgi:hypothetical protein
VGKAEGKEPDAFGYGVIKLNKNISDPDPGSIMIKMLHSKGYTCTLTGHDLSCLAIS